MAMAVGPVDDGGGEGEDQIVSAINTTPLVDVMLVLLIIFLITIPVVTHTVPVSLPKERNQPTQTKPENVIISVNKDGEFFWNQQLVPDVPALFARMSEAAQRVPQPEVHIRGDADTRYEFIGRVVVTCQRAGIAKIAFISEPPPHGA